MSLNFSVLTGKDSSGNRRGSRCRSKRKSPPNMALPGGGGTGAGGGLNESMGDAVNRCGH